MVHPGGRPTVYDPSYCERLIAHMAQGLSFESFGAEIDVGKEALYKWTRKHPEFEDARKNGVEKQRLFWEKLGITGAIGRLKNFNATTWIYNMKCRFRDEWYDQQKVEHEFPKPMVIERASGAQVILGSTEDLKALGPGEGEDDDDDGGEKNV